MQKVFLLISFTLLYAVGKCQDSTEVKAQSLKQRDSIARNMAPVEGKAIVYIIRPTLYGFIISMELYCDSVFMGSTMAQNYVYTVLSPGRHTITARAENKYKFELEVEAGKIYYLKQQVKMGIAFARTKIKLLSEAEGKKYLAKSKLAASNAYRE